MSREHEEPSNPKFVTDDLCKARINGICEKVEGVRREMKILLGSSIITIALIILEIVRDYH